MSMSSLGVWYMFLATFLFALMTVFVKLLPQIPVIEIILFRSIISLLLCFFVLSKNKVKAFGNNKSLLILRGLAGAVALTMNFYLIQVIPLAAASTLTFLAPICTTILGIYFVKEKVKPLQFLFFAASFAGILIVQGFDNRISLFHLLVGLSTSMAMGLAYNCVRRLSSSEDPLVIILYFPLVCLPLTGVWSIFHWTQPQGLDWVYLLMVGLTTQIAQYYMTKSYQSAEISTVSIVSYTGILYSIGLGFFIFIESFNWITYFGIGLVLAGVLGNVVYSTNKAIVE